MDKERDNFALDRLNDPVWYQRAMEQWVGRIYKEEESYSESGIVQDVHTPFSLCAEIVGKLKEHTSLKGKRVLCLNVEFIPFLIGAEEIVVVVDKPLKEGFVNFFWGEEMYPELGYECGDLLGLIENGMFEENGTMKKFDVIVGNPPYQAANGQGKAAGMGGSGSAHSIWPQFVDLALNLVKDDGYLCLVHPAKWRKPEDALWRKMGKFQIKHLSIFNKQQGQKTFGAITRYDWYVLRKREAKGEHTTIQDEQGNTLSMDISKWPFLPNFDFPLAEKVLAVGGEEKVRVICDYKYAVNVPQPFISEDKTKTHKYPLVHAIPKKGPVRLFWSSTQERGHFGIPKVIFGDADIVYNAILDYDGEYAMTQHAMAIAVSSKEEGEAVKKALESEKFNIFLKACRWSNFQIEHKMFRYFRKDFWKEFV